MTYAIFSQDGNLLDSFADEMSAKVAMQNIVAAEPEAADAIAIVTLDASGMPTGEAVYPMSQEAVPVRLVAVMGGESFQDVTRSAAIGSASVTHMPMPSSHSFGWEGKSTGDTVSFTPC